MVALLNKVRFCSVTLIAAVSCARHCRLFSERFLSSLCRIKFVPLYCLLDRFTEVHFDCSVRADFAITCHLSGCTLLLSSPVHLCKPGHSAHKSLKEHCTNKSLLRHRVQAGIAAALRLIQRGWLPHKLKPPEVESRLIWVSKLKTPCPYNSCFKWTNTW